MRQSSVRITTAVTTAVSVAAEVLHLASTSGHAVGDWMPWIPVGGAGLAVLAPSWLLRRARRAVSITGSWTGLAAWHLSRWLFATDGPAAAPTVDGAWTALFVQGTRDHEVGGGVPASLLAASPAAIGEIAWIDGLGHVDLFGAAPDAYRAALERFLARLD